MRYLKRSPTTLTTAAGKIPQVNHEPHTLSQYGSLAVLSGTGEVPSSSLEGQGGSLAPRNKGPSQDLLHEETQPLLTLNTPQARPAAFIPYHMESMTGHCRHNHSE